MIRLWATRGYSWGFRFLRQNIVGDPLPLYEGAFSLSQGEDECFHRFEGGVAIRFVDPEGRKDRSGREIVHDFVLDGAAVGRAASYDEVRDTVWKEVQEEYEALWESTADTE